MAGTVAWTAVAPVKGLALELRDAIELGEGGPVGDRRFYLVDESGRLVNAKGAGVLQQVRPVYDHAARTLVLHLREGRPVEGPVELGPEIDTDFWGEAKRARLVTGPWSDALSDLTGRNLRLVEGEQPAVDRGRSGAATLVSTAALAALAEVLGVEGVDGRRFRMHVGVDGVDAHAEDSWLGRRVRVGEALLIPQGNVGRCAVTTQNPDSGRPDLDTLKALASYRGDLDTTEPLPFGVYASVAEPGVVRVGDPVTLV